jgi:hypothetical protein
MLDKPQRRQPRGSADGSLPSTPALVAAIISQPAPFPLSVLGATLTWAGEAAETWVAGGWPGAQGAPARFLARAPGLPPAARPRARVQGGSAERALRRELRSTTGAEGACWPRRGRRRVSPLGWAAPCSCHPRSSPARPQVPIRRPEAPPQPRLFRTRSSRGVRPSRGAADRAAPGLA